MGGIAVRVAQDISLTVDERKELLAWFRGRTTPARLVTRAHIILLAAEGLQNKEIAEKLQLSLPTARMWRRRFAADGLDGIESDAPRPGRPRSINDSKVSKIVEDTMKSHPANATHWSTREIARVQGVSQSTVVQTINQYAEHYNRNPHQFTWTASADKILEKIAKLKAIYGSGHRSYLKRLTDCPRQKTSSL